VTVFNELEVGLLRHNVDSYEILVRFNRPGEIDRVPIRGRARFDLKAWRQQSLNSVKYGLVLSGGGLD
jgi:hypothetical protein